MSSASITAVAAVENARQLPGKPKTIVFDAQIYLGDTADGEPVSMVGAFRYFNSSNISFSDAGLYVVEAMIAKYEKAAYEELYSTVLSETDYDIVGDVIMLIPIPNAPLEAARQSPFVHVCGVVTKSDSSKSSFEIDAEQRTQVLKSGFFPMRGTFEDSPKFKLKKPMPTDGSVVYVGGFVTEVTRRDQKDQDVPVSEPERFCVSVDQIQFLARSPVPPKVNRSQPAPKTPARQKLKFNFHPPSSPSTPQTPDTPTPASSSSRACKRPRLNSGSSTASEPLATSSKSRT